VEGATYLKYTPVTMPVARIDTELTATDRTKNLVVVGGPCVNREAAAALGVTFPACGEASTIPENAAIIKIVPDYPATGKYTVVVAGWEKGNTRTACAVVQQYATLLKGQAVSAVKVTSATTAGITPL
jgi:S-layer protein (TIGR01564 family)